MLLWWYLSMIQVFSYPLGKSSFHLFVDLKQAIVSVSGRFSPHNFEMFSISPQQACAFRCWLSNNSVKSYFARMLSKFICGKSCHFLLRPFYPNNLASILSFRRHCDVALFTNHLVLSRSCSFRAYPFNQSVVSSLQVLFILSSLASLFNRSVARILYSYSLSS